MSGLDKKGSKYPGGINIDEGELFIDGVAVTATAAEINILDGVTANKDEINTLDGTQRIRKIVKVALGVADTEGGVLAWANPEASSIIITRLIVDVTTKSTAACTLDFGTTAVSATTSSANLIDGMDSGTSAGTFDNISDAGTDGKSRQKLAPGKWVTGSKASGAAAGTAGFAYVEYIVI